VDPVGRQEGDIPPRQREFQKMDMHFGT
jgi:hypothetical protein